MRLTRTFRHGEVHTLRAEEAKLYLKLSKLEDIEEELGIDLITLFKALKNGIYYKLENGEFIKFNGSCFYTKPHKLNINIKNKSLSSGNDNFYFKDYGKTWALTKEELEKGD